MDITNANHLFWANNFIDIYPHMKFQTHTVSQSEVIGNFTPFFPIFTPFFHTFSKKNSRVTTTHHPLPTYEISDSYRQSIRSYWQFHTFSPNFHTFFSHLFQIFFTGHHNSSPSTYIWNFRHIPPVNQKLLAISHFFPKFSHLFFTPFPKNFHGSPKLITRYLHMKFQNHTASQSEDITNFTPFYC